MLNAAKRLKINRIWDLKLHSDSFTFVYGVKNVIAWMVLSDLHSDIRFEFYISAINRFLVWVDYELSQIWYKKKWNHVKK